MRFAWQRIAGTGSLMILLTVPIMQAIPAARPEAQKIQQFSILLHEHPSTLVLRMKKDPACASARPAPVAEVFRKGAGMEWQRRFCQGRWFAAGTGVYDVGDHAPQIMLVIGVGASYGSDIYIYHETDGRLSSVVLPAAMSSNIAQVHAWRPYREALVFSVARMNRDVPYPPRLFRWNGAGYSDESTRYPLFYRNLAPMPFYSHPVPPDGWVRIARYNAQLCYLQKRKERIRPMLLAILKALQDPARTSVPLIAPGIPPQNRQRAESIRHGEIYSAEHAVLEMMKALH